DLALARAEALRVLAGTERAYRAEALNAVGGGWRNLALIHMKMTDYPLGIVHQYEMTRSQALDVARFAMRQSRSSLERIEGISKRRVETLPHAALVLETLIEHLKIERVVISAWGLREGLILEAMDPALRARDPLIEGCAALTARQEFEGGAARELAFALEAWLSAPFARLPAAFGARDSALIAAACELADLGIRLHPDHRADLVFDQVLRAPIAGMDHAERAFLACAAFSRHSARPETPEPQLVQRLLGPARLERARALGAAVRLACELSGRIPALLAHASLAIKPASVVLHIEGAWGPMLGGDQIERRAAQLAGRLGRGLKIRTGPAEAGAKAAAGRAAKRSKVFRAA
ncbi:MAG: Ppx/GppA family phosphatase, partial [Caulobacteraceae bacterium]